jgi:gas vesicle protein
MNKESCMWFTCGLTLGATIALLFAPKSGSETRALIASQAKRGQDALMEQAGQVRDSVSGTMSRGKDALNRAAEGVRSAVGDARKSYAG